MGLTTVRSSVVHRLSETVTQPNNMNSIMVFLSVAATAFAAPQYGGGSAGGLLGHHQPLEHQIIGLGGGQEEDRHDEGGYGISLGGGYGISLGGGYGTSLGGGYGTSDGGHQEEKHYESSIGFTGSNFQTPVDVHHEKEIHLKAHPEYHYDFHVADDKHKDYKSKHESRDGYRVKGSYSLLEPDHKTIRVVDYVSDKKLGFVAKVSYRKHQ